MQIKALKKNCFIKRVYKSNNIFWKVFTWGKNSTISNKREVRKPKDIFCIKVMWKHHMTSPNFGEIFKCINQMVAVQQRLQIHEKSF